MAPPRELIDDAITEIFLRLPPEEPENLFRASLVCKAWLRIITDPVFLRRYRVFHRTPPLLGYIYWSHCIDVCRVLHLVPTTSVSLTPTPHFHRVLDCHHGRILLRAHDNHPRKVHWYLIVWDPVTGYQERVPEAGINWYPFSAAVCCAVSGCDHLNCHGGPFRVIFLGIDRVDVDQVQVCVYSSETGAWSSLVTLGNDCEIYAEHKQDALDSGGYYKPCVQPCRPAVIGDEIYFTVACPSGIIKYNMRMNFLTMINPPLKGDFYNAALMEMEDSSLGFVYFRDSSLYLWSGKLNMGGAPEWVQWKIVELGERLPSSHYLWKPSVVGAAEGVGVIFVSTSAGLFTVKINSGQVKRIDECRIYLSIFPFMSFYTPESSKLIARKAKDSLVSDVPFY